MSTTITRVYAESSHARSVVDQLITAGYRKNTIFAVNAGSATSEEGLAAEIERGGVFKRSAKLYASAVKRGGSLVTVVAPVGTAVDAMTIMDTGKLVDAGVWPSEQFDSLLSSAAPLSSTFGWRVLSHHPAPLSKIFGFGTVTDGTVPKASVSSGGGTSLPFPTLSGRDKVAASVSRTSQILPFATLLRRRGPILPFPTLSRDAYATPRR